MKILEFLSNHLLIVAIVTLLTGIASAGLAFLAVPLWKKRARKAMRRGMAVPANPLLFVPILMIAVFLMACLATAGTDTEDWVVEKTETIQLSHDTQILPHTDGGEKLISVINGESVYVFHAEAVDYVKYSKPSTMKIEYVDAFLRPGYARAEIR